MYHVKEHHIKNQRVLKETKSICILDTIMNRQLNWLHDLGEGYLKCIDEQETKDYHQFHPSKLLFAWINKPKTSAWKTVRHTYKENLKTLYENDGIEADCKGSFKQWGCDIEDKLLKKRINSLKKQCLIDVLEPEE